MVREILCLLAVLSATLPSGRLAQPNVAASATMLVMDVSGSMDDLDRSGVTKIEASRNAADKLLTVIEQDNARQPASHLVGLVAFSQSAASLTEPTAGIPTVRAMLPQLLAGGETNIGEGLDVALTALEQLSASMPRTIILMTDGKPNVGAQTLEQFLQGPVSRARSLGVCIYTVGFGTPGDLNEDLLRGIARESGCGEYAYADAQYGLGVIYSRVRHQATGANVQTFSATIQQGERKTLGAYKVAPNQAVADFTLWWPGSRVDLILADPLGKEVTPGYPGATFLQESTMHRILVEQPIAGDWRMDAYGREVPEALLQIDLIVSTQQIIAASTAGGGAGLAFIFLIVALVCLGLYLFSRAQRRSIVRMR